VRASGALTGEEVAPRVPLERRTNWYAVLATDRGVVARVAPEPLPLSDPLAWVAGTSSIVYFETDIFPGLCITEVNPGIYATAYGLLADFIRAVEGHRPSSI